MHTQAVTPKVVRMAAGGGKSNCVDGIDNVSHGGDGTSEGMARRLVFNDSSLVIDGGR